MSHNVPWQEPYPGVSKLPANQVKRLTIEVPINEANTIVAVTLNPLILTAICKYAIRDTAAFIRFNTLSYSDESFRSLINYICERSLGSTPDEAVPQDDGRREKTVRSGSAADRDKPTSPRADVKKVRGGKKE